MFYVLHLRHLLIAFLSNYLLSGLGENDWRYMMGIEALPALLYTVLVLSIPKSPRWLYLNNQQDEAEKIIRDAYSKNDADELIREIIKDKESSVKSESINCLEHLTSEDSAVELM